MSRIEQIIGEMEEYLDGCKVQAFSGSKRIVVEKDVIDDMLVELRMRTPEEIKKYQKIIANKDDILGEAQHQAEEMVANAERQRSQLVSESEIMRIAYEQSQKLLEDTQAEAQKIIDNATVDAEDIRQSAMNYTDYLLQGVQELLSHSMENFQSRYNSLNAQLQNSLKVVVSNRQELAAQGAQPAEGEAAAEPAAE